MNKKNIGLNATQISVAKEVYYYSFYNSDTNSNSEPKKTIITSSIHFIGQNYCCFVDGVSGVVSISHLSENYYPEEYNKFSKSQENYTSFLSIDSDYSFANFLNIVLPKREYKDGLVRLYSQKYPSVKGDYCRYLKYAKQSYKEKLKNYKKGLK